VTGSSLRSYVLGQCILCPGMLCFRKLDALPCRSVNVVLKTESNTRHIYEPNKKLAKKKKLILMLILPSNGWRPLHNISFFRSACPAVVNIVVFKYDVDLSFQSYVLHRCDTIRVVFPHSCPSVARTATRTSDEVIRDLGEALM